MDGVPIRQAIENEKKFFDTHPVYSKYGDQLGFPNVTKNLNKILIRHIKKCIPNLNKQVTELLQDKEREY
jgi:dynamin 1-like protein